MGKTLYVIDNGAYKVCFTQNDANKIEIVHISDSMLLVFLCVSFFEHEFVFLKKINACDNQIIQKVFFNRHFITFELIGTVNGNNKTM